MARPFARLCLVILLLGLSPARAAPKEFTAVFDMDSAGLHLGETRWSVTRQEAGRYVFESVSTASGLAALLAGGERLERSVWESRGERPRPLSYLYRRTGRKAREVLVDFDWGSGIARTTSRGQTWELQVAAGTMDKLVYVLALMQDLAQGRQRLTYTLADGGKLRTYELQVTGREPLATPLGQLETVKVRRDSQSGEKETLLWCAPSLAYLPVQVEHREEKDGRPVHMTVRAVSGLP
jgi:hypothetical protein